MANISLQELSQRLQFTFRSQHPRLCWDVNSAGEPLLQFTIPNERFPSYAVSYEADTGKSGLITGSLWFGQCEISGHVLAEDAIAAVTSVLSSEIVTVIRFKNQALYEDRHPAGQQWVYQLESGSTPASQTEDGRALDALLARLETPATWRDKISGVYLGIFEIARWDDVRVIRR